MSKLALIHFGYQQYAVPVEELSEALRQFAGLRKVESRYDKDGYVYWFASPEDDRDVNVTVVPAERIHASEPAKAAPPAAAAKQPKPDARVVAAPSDADPISIRSVPPMRDFVDAYRDGEPAPEREETAS